MSKHYLAGTKPEEWIPLRPPEFYSENAIELRLVSHAEWNELVALIKRGDLNEI